MGRARYGRGITRLTGLAATVFFMCLYLDGLAFNRAETEVTSLVEKLPPGQRVVAAMSDSGARLNALLHVADHAPASGTVLVTETTNQEPVSSAFKCFAGPNRVVASDKKAVQDIEEGQHIVTAAEEPLYSICPDRERPRPAVSPRDLRRSKDLRVFTGHFAASLDRFKRYSGGNRNQLARDDQRQVPDHQRGVPIIDQPDYMHTAAPDTESS